MEKREKNSKGLGSPEKKEKKCEGGIPTYPRIFEGVCMGGANRGVIFFLFHEDRLTRKKPFLLGWEEGTGEGRKGGKKPEGIGEEEKRGKNQARGKNGFKLLERSISYLVIVTRWEVNRN